MSRKQPDPDSFIPLKPVHFMILLSVLDQDRHGYGIVKDIAERTEGQLVLEPGNLYRFVRHLLGEGLLRQVPSRPKSDEDERRRYLGITPLGRKVVHAETERMKSLVRQVEHGDMAHPGS